MTGKRREVLDSVRFKNIDLKLISNHCFNLFEPETMNGLKQISFWNILFWKALNGRSKSVLMNTVERRRMVKAFDQTE